MTTSDKSGIHKIRQRINESREFIAPELLYDSCATCEHYQPGYYKYPCALYSPETVYFDRKEKRFCCKFWSPLT